MKCPKCNSENSDSAKFCKSCGEKLESNEAKKSVFGDNKTIIIALAAIVALLVVGTVIASGVLTQTELETREFDGFMLDVPVDSDFILDQSHTTDKDNVFVGYLNDGKDIDKVGAFQVGMNLTEKIVEVNCEKVGQEGDLKIYKNESDGELFYKVFKKGDDANIVLYGEDLDVLKKMAESFKDKDFKKLAAEPEEAKTVSSSVSPSSQKTSTPMSILGGSFETGGGLEDKTYASIYVGPEHSGESVTIQIFYSRDGATLNNGNMVPKTVDSSGYIHVRSADAYELFPDYADINLYDSAGNLADSRSVSLSPTSGTQTF